MSALLSLMTTKKKTEKTTECTLNKHVSKETWKKNDRAINSTKKKKTRAFCLLVRLNFFFSFEWMNEVRSLFLSRVFFSSPSSLFFSYRQNACVQTWWFVLDIIRQSFFFTILFCSILCVKERKNRLFSLT